MYALEVDVILTVLVFLVGGLVFAVTATAIALSYGAKQVSEALRTARAAHNHVRNPRLRMSTAHLLRKA